MSFKERVSEGEHVEVEYKSRQYAGAPAKTIVKANGDTAQVELEGKDLSKLHQFAGFTGHTGSGACTLAEAVKGDVVLGVVDLAGGSASSSFESVITVAGQIQQSSGSDLSTHHFAVMLLKRG